MILSFVRKDVVIFSFIASIFFAITAISSFNVEKITCEYNTEWSCYSYGINLNSLGILFSTFGILMFFYAVFSALYGIGDEIGKVGGS